MATQSDPRPPRADEPPPAPPPLAQRLMRLIVLVVAVMLLVVALRGTWDSGRDWNSRISYSTFREQVISGNVQKVTIQGESIEGILVHTVHLDSPTGEEQEYARFITYLPSVGDEGLLALLEENGVEVETLPTGDGRWWPLLISWLPLILLFAVWMFFLMRTQGRMQSLLGLGGSGAKLYERTREATTFADVAGASAAKRELQEIIAFLRRPEQFTRLGAEIPKGVMIVGPPGTGKTLLARAVAGEAGVPFYSITGSDFMEMFVGVGARRVRDLFGSAKEAAPSIIFIDELDSIGRRRGTGLGGGHDEREQTLNQLLSELDGFEANENVIVMAATNRPDILDPALLRPGRFDRRVTVDLPTTSERVEILELHARRKPLDKDVDLEEVARGTPGFSGADLRNLLNEAALGAARRDRTSVGHDDVEEARDKILMGLEREGLALTERELRFLAYHEGGHALLAALLPHSDPVHKVTIIPRGRAMGSTHQLPERERHIYEREYMLERIVVLMGGRAAEELVFATMTSGAEDDLREATRLARKMVLDWGMSDRFGPMASERRREHVFLGEEIARGREYSEETAREVDEAVKEIVEECREQARGTIERNRAALDRIATRLLEKEVLTGDEVAELVKASSEAA